LLQRHFLTDRAVGGRLRRPPRQVLHRHIAANQTGGHNFPERVQLELVVGHEHQLRFLLVEVNGGLGALEIVSLRNFLSRLVERVIYLLQIDVRGDVERTLRRHAPQW
jgi:hypothetical protein